MQENTEDKMFQQLLGDYAAPAEDNGFSDFVLATLPRPKNHKRLKSLLVGGAGALGAAIAFTQVQGLWAYISGVKIPALPTVEAPSMDVSALTNSGLMASSYTPVLLGLVVIIALWMGQALIFGDDV